MEAASEVLGREAVAAGELRPEVAPMDLLRTVYGGASATNEPDWESRARQLVDVLLEGARPLGRWVVLSVG